MRYNTGDYASNAFYLYARMGKPKDINGIKTKNKPLRDDIAAVIDMIDYFDKNDKQYINHAVEAVYFTLPKRVRKNDVSNRVLKLSLQFPASESTIYLWLKEAKRIFSEQRGLFISEMYPECSEWQK